MCLQCRRQSESRLLFECCGVVFLALTFSFSLFSFLSFATALGAMFNQPLRTGMFLQCRPFHSESCLLFECCAVVFLALTLCLSLSFFFPSTAFGLKGFQPALADWDVSLVSTLLSEPVCCRSVVVLCFCADPFLSLSLSLFSFHTFSKPALSTSPCGLGCVFSVDAS